MKDAEAWRMELAARKPSVVVDWDGTCVEHVWPDRGDWLPEARGALRAMLDADYRVRIFSCRLHAYDLNETTPIDPEYRAGEVAYIRSMLDEAGLEDVEIITSSDKPPAVAYIDDRSVHFNGRNWIKIVADLLGQAPVIDYGEKVRYHDEETGYEKETSVYRFDLIPPDALAELARVYGVGEQKYPSGPNGPNWLQGGPWWASTAALERHLASWKAGQDNDPSDDCYELAKVAWHAIALLTYTLRGLGVDTRAKIRRGALGA